MEINTTNSGLRVPYPVRNIQFNNHNLNQIFFGQAPAADSFKSTSVTRFFDENEIRKMISSNPEIKRILSENNISGRLNMIELEELRTGHCKDTQDIAMGIANNLMPALKQKVNIKNLKEGAQLHDFGKVLIPSEILNKASSLTVDEHKIMDLHSELGYQLLKNTGLSDDVLSLVRYHHQASENKKYVPNIDLQILNLADKYSALTEKRVYKDKFSPEKALTILSKCVESGEVHPFLFNALVKSVNNNTSADMLTNVK
ncbi:MAG: HD domain-containing protein [Muribaculaceae bacterium]|nr:HD domain-containing protein [Muribaculaceae bacterium]